MWFLLGFVFFFHGAYSPFHPLMNSVKLCKGKLPVHRENKIPGTRTCKGPGKQLGRKGHRGPSGHLVDCEPGTCPCSKENNTDNYYK